MRGHIHYLAHNEVLSRSGTDPKKQFCGQSHTLVEPTSMPIANTEA
jgi:hypothetical protein